MTDPLCLLSACATWLVLPLLLLWLKKKGPTRALKICVALTVVAGVGAFGARSWLAGGSPVVAVGVPVALLLFVVGGSMGFNVFVLSTARFPARIGSEDSSKEVPPHAARSFSAWEVELRELGFELHGKRLVGWYFGGTLIEEHTWHFLHPELPVHAVLEAALQTRIPKRELISLGRGGDRLFTRDHVAARAFDVGAICARVAGRSSCRAMLEAHQQRVKAAEVDWERWPTVDAARARRQDLDVAAGVAAGVLVLDADGSIRMTWTGALREALHTTAQWFA